jgi:multidrug efflux pump subunit AcrB
MVVSLTLTPIMAAGRLGPRPGKSTSRRWMERLAALYERWARVALRHPVLSAAVLIAVVAAGGVSVLHPTTGFLPDMDEGAFVLDYTMPVGTSLSETDANCSKIEKILAETPEVTSFSRRTGAELGFFATEQFRGDFLVGFKPRGQRRRPSAEIIDGLRQRIAREVPEIEVSFVLVMQDTLNDLAGNPAPLEVKVFGTDYHALQLVAERIAGQMEHLHGVVDVTAGVSFGNPEITYRVDADAAERAGLTTAAVQQQLQTALLGERATQLRRSDRLVPVFVRYPDAVRRDPTGLAQLPLTDGSGRVVPASLVSKVEERLNVNELARENQQPLVSVDANISGVDLGTAADAVRRVLATTPHPRDVRLELGGQVESQARAFANLLTVLALASGLVFLLLVMQFRSYRLPLIIFLTLPPSQIGALLALRLTGTALNISSFMGLIMLVGLVVKNGIIFIEYAAQLREEGVPTLTDALATAGAVRLRPMLMTSLAAMIAMLPLALNLGAGAELQRPLAIAVIGGLTVSTLFTLFVVPVAHILLGEPVTT